MGRDGAVAALAVACASAPGCLSTPPPLGEVVIAVDTDADVPAMVSRLRVDLFTETGRWYESREFPADDPGAFPLGFGVVTDREDRPRTVRVRLRGYLGGRSRDERGLRPTTVLTPPRPAPSEPAAACASVPVLEPFPAKPLRLRTSRSLVLPTSCGGLAAGAAPFTLRVATAGRYLVQALDATAHLEARPSCGAAPVSDCRLQELERDLSAGEHSLLVATDTPFADVQLVASLVSDRDAALAAAASPAPTGEPRLFRVLGGPDETPETEPEPGTTIDQVFDLVVQPATVAHVRVLLSTRCFGVEADVQGGRSCVDGALAPVALRTGTARSPAPSSVGSFARGVAADPCPGGADEEHVCVAGGVHRLGDRALVPSDVAQPSSPERFVVVRPRLVDRHEYTVGRYRAALAKGFVATDAVGGAAVDPTCTVDGAPDLPLNCVPWTTARALCRFEGGDLPTETAWEWAASGAGTVQKQLFPWGNARSGCSSINIGCTPTDPSGLFGVDDPRFVADRSPLGLVGMTGNVMEWTLDTAEPYDGPRFRSIDPLEAATLDELASHHAARGLSFREGALLLGTVTRRRISTFSRDARVGFRCARG
ncbi:MAG: SUMF1/EgtB/PvdO family nonheme iron enzyme [Myxococcales bacterium]|nr:SUMF1/EgtB/PvdO family nonheme iron enzyme [Myxococcales bacterium]